MRDVEHLESLKGLHGMDADRETRPEPRLRLRSQLEELETNLLVLGGAHTHRLDRPLAEAVQNAGGVANAVGALLSSNPEDGGHVDEVLPEIRMLITYLAAVDDALASAGAGQPEVALPSWQPYSEAVTEIYETWWY